MLGEHNYHTYKVQKTLLREKVACTQLQRGMYVVELDRPWVETPFLFQGFLINTEEEIDQLCHYCEFVYIDVAQTEVKYQVKGKTKRHLKNRRIYKIATEKELPRALNYYHKAKVAVDNALQAMRLSHDLDIGEVKVSVRSCVKSVLNNPNALMWLTQIKNKDEYTAEHSLRVSVMSVALGRELGLLEQELEDLGVAAMLHDVGKVKIPDAILNKEGSLDEQEYQAIKAHTVEGRQLLLSKSDVPPVAVDVAYAHHEHVNGKGYPRGIGAEKIPYFAKIVSVVDAYDAISSDRIYSGARSTLESLRILYDCRDLQFDEEIVRAFIRMVGVYPPGHIVELTNGEAGIILSCPQNNKLRPKIIVVRNKNKQNCSERIVDLSKDHLDQDNQPLRVKQVLTDGAFGIKLAEYRNKGLIFGRELAAD